MMYSLLSPAVATAMPLRPVLLFCRRYWEGCRYRDIPQHTAAPGNTAVLYHSKYGGAAVFQYLVALW